MFKNFRDLEKVDLHIHSCYSDGELKPSEIVQKWIDEGYETIAITDHDGIEGSRIGQEFSCNLDVEFITGIEFDSENHLGYDFHILGYDIDLNAKELNEAIQQIYKWRCERNDRLIKSINALGYELTDSEVNAVDGGTYIGKPTVAKALIAKGYASNISEAFGKIISVASKDGCTYKKTLGSERVIEIIHASGGIAVLAHPMEQKKNGELWEDYKIRLLKILDTFIEYGIDGVECYHPSASKEQSKFLLEYCRQHNLIVTKGSDFHSESLKRDYSKYHI